MGDEFVVSGIRFSGCKPLPATFIADVPPYEVSITLLPDGTFDLNLIDLEREVGDSWTFDEIEDAKRAALEMTGATDINWVSPSPDVGA